MPPADRERALQQQTTVTRFISYGYPAIILVWNALIAAVLFATFKLGLSADINSKRAYATVMYGSLPLVIKTVLAVIAVVAGVNTDSFTFQNPVATNPGYFLNAAENHVLYSLGTALDTFMIWTLVLPQSVFRPRSSEGLRWVWSSVGTFYLWRSALQLVLHSRKILTNSEAT